MTRRVNDELTRALARTQKAKAENDERFQLERDEARSERDAALQEVARLRAELGRTQALLAEARSESARLSWECGKLTARARL